MASWRSRILGLRRRSTSSRSATGAWMPRSATRPAKSAPRDGSSLCRFHGPGSNPKKAQKKGWRVRSSRLICSSGPQGLDVSHARHLPARNDLRSRMRARVPNMLHASGEILDFAALSLDIWRTSHWNTFWSEPRPADVLIAASNRFSLKF